MARTKKRIFDGLYAQLEETDGNVVLFSAKGEPSVIFEITNPVQQLCTDAEQYMLFQDVLSNVVQTLGEGYALQKQDVLCKQSYHHEVPEDAEFLTKSYFRYFEGREFTEIRTYLILTQEVQRSQFVQYDPKKWLDFHSKVSKVSDILKEKNIKHRKLSKTEVDEYCHRFMAFQFRHGPFSMTNFKASDEYLKIGDRVVRSYPLVDIDEINLPSLVKPYTQMNINGYGIATDLFSFLTSVPHADCVVFNQVVQIPNQRKLLRKLQAKAKRHGSMPDPSNKIAKEDIEEVLDRLAVDSTQLVYCNFNILVSCPADKVTPVTSYLETKLYECGIMPSRTAYNQLELFTDSFPGNGIASSLQVGDVVCSDGSVLSKEKFSSSQKEPVAIVYHVNRNPEIKALGYAVSIRDVASTAFADSLGVEQETSASLEKEDGNENTHAMYRNEEVKSPLAVYVFDMWRYGQSAYIPSVKQLTYLYQQIGLVNQRIEAVGGLPISLQPGDCWLWTSTEVEGQRDSKAWLFSMQSGTIQETPKDQAHKFRPVISIY